MSLNFRIPLFLAAAGFFREVTQENEVTRNYPRGGMLLSGDCGNGCLNISWLHKGTTRPALPSGMLSAPNGTRIGMEVQNQSGVRQGCACTALQGVHDEAASLLKEALS